MYQEIDGTLTISVNDWVKAGLSKNMFEHDSKRGDLTIVRRGIHGNTRIDVKSIRRPERMQVIEASLGKLEKEAPYSKYNFEIDANARNFFVAEFLKQGLDLDDKIETYTNRASLLETIKRALATHRNARAKSGKKVNMGDFYKEATAWYMEQIEKHPCSPISNWRTMERVFKRYINEHYMSIMHKNTGNDAARLVSLSMERLFLSLWRTNNKPFVTQVHADYLEFVSGTRELFDKETGEIFRPEDFRHKGRAMEISVATVWNYLKDVVNETAVYSDRNGNFDYVNTRRPKQKRKRGLWTLSKISMDDVCLSRKSVRGYVYKYISVDVLSGYIFRPAYVVGKPTIGTVTESFRNMFCELETMNLPMPGELEVEYHLMKDIPWLNDLFPFVRFCNSPTEKRVEHTNRQFKYGVSKREGHTRGRWYSKSEAYKSVRNKVAGDFVEPEFQPQTIVADDLNDIEKYNNELHPLQKRFPGMTRKQVLLANINPKLQPIEKQYLYRHIGNETQTSLYNNDYCLVQGNKFELTDFSLLERLKSNNRELTAYWLPEEDGTIETVYIYQGDTYVGEAINSVQFEYNENAIERTEEDEAKILYQNKRLAKFDKYMREKRKEIPKVGNIPTEQARKIESVEIDIVETVQPKGMEEYEENEDFNNIDWGKRAVSSL